MKNNTNISHKYDYFTSKPGNILFALYLLIYILILIGSITNIVVIKLTSKLHNVSGYLMMHVSFVDVLFAHTLIVPVIALVNENSYFVTICLINGTLTVALAGVSLWTITLLNLDRFIAIIKPLTYKTIIDKKRMVITLLIIWLIMISSCSPSFFESNIKLNPNTFQCYPKIQAFKELYVFSAFLSFGMCSTLLLIMYTM